MSRILLTAAACAVLALPLNARENREDMFYRLVQVNSGKVLGIADDSEEGGARAVVAKPDEKNHAQEWKLEKDGGFFKLTNRKTGKVLDVNENSTDEDAPIIQWDEKGDDNDNQRWSWVGDGADRRIKSKSSNLALDVDGDGKVVQKKASDTSKGQLWKLVPVK